MSAALRNPGEYRGRILEYSLLEKKKDKNEFAGLSLFVKIAADEVWMAPEEGGAEQWLNCSAWDAHGEGWLVLITKAGKVNETQIKTLVKYAGWDGDFQSLADKSWEPKPVRFDVQYNVFNNQGSYRINWLNEYDSEPGVAGNVDAERAKALGTQYGSVIRALIGNQQRAATSASAGRPATPRPQSRPQPRKPAAASAPAQAADEGGGDIPF